LKRRIKRSLKSLKNYVSKLKVIQKILPARLRVLWFAAFTISSIWFLYWICYDVLVWNKALTQARTANYVGLTASIALAILGTQLGKLGILEKLTLFLQQHIHKEAIENQQATEEKQIKPIKPAQQTRPAKKKLKRRIKSGLFFKNCVSKLNVVRIKSGLFFKNCVSKLNVVSQKILLLIIAMLKQVSLRLKLKLSAIFQSMSTLKTRMISTVPHGLRIRDFVTKKGKKMMLLLLIVASLVLNLFLLSTISGQFATRTQMYSHGSIQVETAGLATYRDASCTTRAYEIPWGTLAPGSSGEYVFYIKNEGTTSLNLFLNTANWSPTNAANHITLSWNYNGQAVAPNQVVQITLTLKVSQSISGIDNFSFDIVLTGTGAS